MAYQYIKRAEEEYIWKSVFAPAAEEDGYCMAIHGPNNIGKSYLINHIIKRFESTEHPHVFCFKTTLMGFETCWEYWFDLFGETMYGVFSREVLESAPEANDEDVNSIMNALAYFHEGDADSANLGKAKSYLGRILTKTRAIGIRIILSIDEFDLAAQKGFSDNGNFFLQLFKFSRKALTDKNHSIVLISRRGLRSIQGSMAGGSSLESAYDEHGKTLGGFDDSQMNEYFSKYSIRLELDQKRDIVYYCGRNPGLLENMLRWHEEVSREKISISQLYENNRTSFIAPYKRMCQLMKDEKFSTDIRCFDAFLEEFIGPVTSDTHTNDLEEMHNYGFVTKNCAGDSPYRMFDMPYDPLSPEFVQYVIQQELPGDLNRASELLAKTETKFRTILHKFGLHVFGDNEKWMGELDCRLKSVRKEKYALHNRFYDSYKRACQENNAEDRVITGTKLDVISISDLYDLACSFGASLSPVFDGLDCSSGEAKEIFDFLTDCRNLDGHRNIKVLDSKRLARLTSLCESLLEKFNTVMPKILEQSSESLLDQIPEIKELGIAADSPKALENSIAIMINITKGRNGNLKGGVKGTTYNVSIPKKDAAELSLTSLPSELKVKLGNWDPNPDSPHYEAIPVTT